MAYTVEDYHRDLKKEAMEYMTPDDLDNLLKRFGPEESLKRLKPEDVLKIYRPEERLKGLKPEEIEAYLKKLNKKTKRK